MIWNSVPLMTLFDVLILGVVLFVCSGYWRNRHMIKRLGFQPVALLTLLGIITVAAFHLADLYAMFVMPTYVPKKQAMEAMKSLHLNWRWIEALLGIAAVAMGFTYFLAVFMPKTVSRLESRVSDLEIVKEIARAVGSTLEPLELFKTIVHEIRRVVPCERCVFSTLSDGIRQNWYIESHIKIEATGRTDISKMPFWIRDVYEKKCAVNIPDIREIKIPRAKVLTAAGFRSILSIPILQDERCIAHLTLVSTRLQNFSDEHEKFLISIANFLGSAVRNATLYRAVQDRSARLTVLNELNGKITENLDLDEVLESITGAAVGLLGIDLARFRLLDEATGELVVRAVCGNIPAPTGQQSLLFGDGIAGRADGKFEPMIFPDVREISQWSNMEWAREVGVHSLLVYPLLLRSTVIGTINCYSRERGFFSQEHLNLLSDLASQAVIAIENAKLHEEAKKSRDFFRSVVNDNADAIYVTDGARKVILWNGGAENLYGYAESEAIGSSVGDLIIPPERREKWFASREFELESIFRKGKSSRTEIMHCKKDGTAIHVEVTRSPVHNEKGEVTAICTVSKDLTERKRYEEELKAARDEAETASRAKSEFLSTMSHELRSPLNTVIGFSDLLERDTKDEMTRQIIPKIRDSGKYLLALIEEILDLDRIEIGKVRLKVESALINDIVSGVVNSWHPRLPGGYSLSLELDPSCGAISCDSTRISQILNNLIDNAVKYSPDGGAIEVCTQAKHDEVLVIVRDEGMGMTPEDTEIIFDRFQQLESGYTRRAGGLGIGLALARKLMELQGGRIWAESKKGEGSTFTLALPLFPVSGVKKTVPNGEAEKPASQGDPWEGRTILIVDDEEPYHEYMKLIMTSATLLDSAFNGEEAIETARRIRPDLILMDLRMPVMNGLEATKRLKSDPEAKDILIIGITAQSTVMDREQFLRAGADGYLTKPLDFKALEREMGRVLGMRV